MLAFYQSYHYNDKRADLCFIRYDKAHTYIFWYIIRQLHMKQDRGSWWESGTVPQLYGELSHGKSVTRTWEARNSVRVPACFYCRKPGSFKVRDMGWLLEAVLAKSVKGAAPHKEMKRMYGYKRASLGRNHAAEPLCEIRPMIFLKIEKLSNE